MHRIKRVFFKGTPSFNGDTRRIYGIIGGRLVALSKIVQSFTGEFLYKILHREDTHFIELNVYFSNIYPCLEEIPSSSYVDLFYPNKEVSDFMLLELSILLTDLSQNTCYPFGLRLCVAVSEKPVIRLRMSRGKHDGNRIFSMYLISNSNLTGHSLAFDMYGCAVLSKGHSV